MKETPLVSVLMTVYNREKFIAEAIESVLKSSYTNFELIIVDDCSTDKSVEIARNYETKDSRIKLYINEENLGDYPNRNKAASYAKGKYIKYLDSDDIIYPHGLQVMVEAMERFPEAGIGMTYNTYDNQKKLPILISSEEAYIRHFCINQLLIIGPSGAIYSRSYFNEIGKFKFFGVASDYEFNLRAVLKKPLVLFHRDLFWWRQHEFQEYIIQNKNYDYIIYNYSIHKQIIPQLPVSKEIRNIIRNNNNTLMGRRLIKLLYRQNFNTFFYLKSKCDLSYCLLFNSILNIKKCV